MSVLDIIKGSPIFDELYDNEIDTITSKSSVLSLKKNDFIVRENDEGDEIFIILSGEARVMKKDVQLATLRKGDLFGELVLLNEQKRTADIIATTYTDVLILKYSEIFSLYKTNPKIFSLLILNLSRLLTVRLKKAGADIESFKIQLNKMNKKK